MKRCCETAKTGVPARHRPPEADSGETCGPLSTRRVSHPRRTWKVRRRVRGPRMLGRTAIFVVAVSVSWGMQV